VARCSGARAAGYQHPQRLAQPSRAARLLSPQVGSAALALLLTGRWPANGRAKEGLELGAGQHQLAAYSNTWAVLLLSVLAMQLWVLWELAVVRGQLQQLQP
jgi:hypothetical protein